MRTSCARASGVAGVRRRPAKAPPGDRRQPACDGARRAGALGARARDADGASRARRPALPRAERQSVPGRRAPHRAGPRSTGRGALPPRRERAVTARPCGNRLSQLIAARGWSDAELARRASLSRAHVNRIKNRRVRPTLRDALLLERALGVTVEAIFVLR